MILSSKGIASPRIKERVDYLPRLKMVLAEFRLYFCNGYQDQGDDAQRRQQEVDVYVGEQAGLRDYIVLEELQCPERRNAGGTAIAVNQIGILREGRASGGVQTIGDVQEP